MKLVTAAEEIERLAFISGTDTDEIQLLLEQHPDLMVYRSGEGMIYCSASVNNYVTNYDQTENAGGAPTEQFIYVWPYLTSMGRRVYSNPPYFIIGRVNDRGFGVEPNPKWDEDMDQVQIPSTVSRKVRSFLKSKPPISYT